MRLDGTDMGLVLITEELLMWKLQPVLRLPSDDESQVCGGKTGPF